MAKIYAFKQGLLVREELFLSHTILVDFFFLKRSRQFNFELSVEVDKELLK